jgi:hypothetical protein
MNRAKSPTLWVGKVQFKRFLYYALVTIKIFLHQAVTIFFREIPRLGNSGYLGYQSGNLCLVSGVRGNSYRCA